MLKRSILAALLIIVLNAPAAAFGQAINSSGAGGGAPVSTGQTGAAGGKGSGWSCDTTAGTCTAL